jgi:hypothetical protein
MERTYIIRFKMIILACAVTSNRVEDILIYAASQLGKKSHEKGTHIKPFRKRSTVHPSPPGGECILRKVVHRGPRSIVAKTATYGKCAF